MRVLGGDRVDPDVLGGAGGEPDGHACRHPERAEHHRHRPRELLTEPAPGPHEEVLKGIGVLGRLVAVVVAEPRHGTAQLLLDREGALVVGVGLGRPLVGQPVDDVRDPVRQQGVEAAQRRVAGDHRVELVGRGTGDERPGAIHRAFSQRFGSDDRSELRIEPERGATQVDRRRRVGGGHPGERQVAEHRERRLHDRGVLGSDDRERRAGDEVRFVERLQIVGVPRRAVERIEGEQPPVHRLGGFDPEQVHRLLAGQAVADRHEGIEVPVLARVAPHVNEGVSAVARQDPRREHGNGDRECRDPARAPGEHEAGRASRSIAAGPQRSPFPDPSETVGEQHRERTHEEKQCGRQAAFPPEGRVGERDQGDRRRERERRAGGPRGERMSGERGREHGGHRGHQQGRDRSGRGDLSLRLRSDLTEGVPGPAEGLHRREAEPQGVGEHEPGDRQRQAGQGGERGEREVASFEEDADREREPRRGHEPGRGAPGEHAGEGERGRARHDREARYREEAPAARGPPVVVHTSCNLIDGPSTIVSHPERARPSRAWEARDSSCARRSAGSVAGSAVCTSTASLGPKPAPARSTPGSSPGGGGAVTRTSVVSEDATVRRRASIGPADRVGSSPIAARTSSSASSPRSRGAEAGVASRTPNPARDSSTPIEAAHATQRSKLASRLRPIAA